MEGKGRMTASGYRVYFEGERSVLKPGCSDRYTTLTILKITGEFLGSPVVRTWCFHYWGLDSIPGQGSINKILQAIRFYKKKLLRYNF